MSKKSRFRGPYDKKYGKWDQTVLKSQLHPCYHIYWSLGRQLSSKNSLLVIGKISRLFLNTSTADQKYCLLNRQFNGTNSDPIISKREYFFSSFFRHFWNVDKTLKIFKKRMTLVADVFSKLRSRKTVVR